jgi:tRNA modification GTPase trmE
MNDTISAISTAYGEGGIGIVRMSGSRSYEILSDIFDNIDKVENRKLTYGHIRDPRDGRTVDEVLVAYMKAPHTYTGEDVVEINCHGSMVALRKILDITLKEGASLAEKGEFTKRAFLNGKIDLSQAEAVIDLIKASSSSGYDVALSQLDGSFGKNISEIRQKLVDILVDITVNIDYPDEDIEEIVYENLRENIFKIKEDIDYLISTSDTGRILKDGIKIAIIGKPNVGKSSLMNRLLMENRAIVTDIPGTTRDVIQENMMIRNIPVILIDTAGIRKTDDKIEKIGIEKSKETFNDADLILFLLNSGDVITDEDYSIMNRVANKNVLVLLNKSDMDRKIETDRIKEILGDKTFLDTSMETGQGVEELKDIIEKMVYKGNLKQDNSLVVTNVRHLNLLRDASAFLEDSLKSIDSNQPLEFIEIDVKNTYDDLGAILGEEVGDDILNEVFSRFCLGK